MPARRSVITPMVSRRLAPVLSHRAGWLETLAGAAAAVGLAELLHGLLTPVMGTTFANVVVLPAAAGVGLWFGFGGVGAFYVFVAALWWWRFGAHAPSGPARFATVSIGVLMVGLFTALLKTTVQTLEEERAALAESERRYRARIQSSPQFFWAVDPQGRPVERSGDMGRALEADPSATWVQFVHPEDRPAAEAAWTRALAEHTPFDAEYRQEIDGRWRWVRAFARYDEAGDKSLWYGVTEDIADRKHAEAARALLMREIDHRSRNILSVVQALVRMTPRTNVNAYAQAVESRIVALAGAHSLLSSSAWRGADLRALLEQELRPYHGSWSLEGPEAALRPEWVQPLVLVTHELATNAAKYGALSRPDGTVRVDWRLEDRRLHLTWRERGGPPVAAPARKGFGTTLIAGSVGGELSYDWAPEGLTVAFALADAVV